LCGIARFWLSLIINTTGFPWVKFSPLQAGIWLVVVHGMEVLVINPLWGKKTGRKEKFKNIWNDENFRVQSIPPPPHIIQPSS